MQKLRAKVTDSGWLAVSNSGPDASRDMIGPPREPTGSTIEMVLVDTTEFSK